MSRLVVKYFPPNELRPASYNPREMEPEAFEGLKASLKKFGLVDPLVMNIRTGLLVGGHQRLRAAQEIGMAEVPVVMVELTPVEEKALNITLNNQNISGYFTDALEAILDEIRIECGDEFVTDLMLHDIVIDEIPPEELPVEPAKEPDPSASATIKVRCPLQMKDEVSMYIRARLLETGFEGVEVV